MTDLAAYVRQTVDRAPDLSDAQCDRLATLLRPSADLGAAGRRRDRTPVTELPRPSNRHMGDLGEDVAS